MDPKDPNWRDWRDQYAGGLKPDPEVEAALSGSSPSISFRPAPSPFPSGPSVFGQFRRLG